MPYFAMIGRYTPEYGWVKFAVLTLFVPFNDIQKAAKLVFFVFVGRVSKIGQGLGNWKTTFSGLAKEHGWFVLVSVCQCYPLVICYIAMENSRLFIDGLPIENGDF